MTDRPPRQTRARPTRARPTRACQTRARLKSYSGHTGYVYEYVFIGRKRTRRGWWRRGAAYAFDVSANRKNIFRVTVFVAGAAVREWERAHGRPLAETEQYAAAKMRLFRAFDEVERMEREASDIAVERDNIGELLSALDIS